jgi:small subunit ribosomal protein S9
VTSSEFPDAGSGTESSEMSSPVTETPDVNQDADLAAIDAAYADVDDAGDHAAADDVTDATGDVAAPPVVPSVVRVAVDRPVLTVGRRKEAIVRVRLVPGTGVFTLNGRSLDSYFPNKVHQQLVKEPLVALEKDGIYDVIARLSGGGVTGQAGALQLGIARALIELEENDRPALKKAGFLTRDARVKERKKYGLKKARKAPQYSKR